MDSIVANSTLKEKNARLCGVDLLKVIGIILVVVSHVTQTLETDGNSNVGFNDYYINLNQATTDFQKFILILLRYSGSLGNGIFFVCSAWFLIDKKSINVRKMWSMVIDVFVISICWLTPMIIFKGIDVVGWEMVIKSLMPTFFACNWYITYYILFCFACPFLNIIVSNINQKTHLSVSIILFFCYLFSAFVYKFPGTSNLITWISIYFVVSYFKEYCPEICNNKKINLYIFMFGIVGTIVLAAITNLVGLKVPFLLNRVQHWNKNCSFLNLMVAFGLLNILRTLNHRCKFVSYISGQSLLVYVIHDNILFRTFIRPQVWEYIFLNFGYDLILLWHFIYTLVLLFASLLIAVIYKYTIKLLVNKVTDIMYRFVIKIWDFINDYLFNTLR